MEGENKSMENGLTSGEIESNSRDQTESSRDQTENSTGSKTGNQAETKMDSINSLDNKKDLSIESFVKPMKKEKIPGWQSGRQKTFIEDYHIFMAASLFFGIMYAWCMYQNPFGITYPVLILSLYGMLLVMLHKLEVPVKKDSWFIIAVAMILGTGVCLTADIFLIGLTKISEFLLLCVFMVHQFHEDKEWSIGRYMIQAGTYFFNCIAVIGYPFLQGSMFFKKKEMKSNKNLIYISIGILSSIPIVIIMGILLAQADAVFGNMLEGWFEGIFHMGRIFVIISMIILGTWWIYCTVAGACMENSQVSEKDTRTHEPMVAAAFMGTVTLMYLIFSVIQIVYLFLGKGALPDGMTFSEYARQGFFQLLFVAVINLFMVLMSLKYFRKSNVLNTILTVVCVCTYIMIASAAYRMLLYVGEYHLTYLRVLVLWFLILLAILLTGVTVLIYKNKFPLFRYCLTVVSVFYVSLVLVKPGRVIAQYNVQFINEWTREDFNYMTYDLSADAAPIIMEALKEDEVLDRFYLKNREEFISSYGNRVIDNFYNWENGGIRKYNFSFDRAVKSIYGR